MRPRKPRTPSCATSWEQSSSRRNASGRGSGPAASERENAAPALCEGIAWEPVPRFSFGSDFEKKESGPDIAARPAYIRGANDRIRTGDLRFTRALLYQLSHVGTRLLAKREYELYRRACRFARGKCNFSSERAGIRGFSTGLRPSVAALESRTGTRLNRCGHHSREPRKASPIAAVIAPENRPSAPYHCGNHAREPHGRTSSPATPRPRVPSPPARGPGPRAAHSCSRCPACRAERPARGCP